MIDANMRRAVVGIFAVLTLLLIGGCGDIVIAPDPCQCGICPDGSPPSQTECPTSIPFCVDNICSAQCPAACSVQICGVDPECGDCGVCVDDNEVCKSGACECVPACTGLACGADGCGGQCGECSEGTGCRDGACEDEICTPGASYCDGQNLAKCDDLGLGTDGPAAVTDCAQEHGGQGVCENTDEDEDGVPETAACVCVPACDGLVCGDDGCGGECGACDAGTACLDGACETMICTPGAPFCLGSDGDLLNTCDDLGLGAHPETGPLDCASEHGGQGACEVTDADEDGIPETAACVCVPECADKACNEEDGCGQLCATHLCPDGEHCYPKNWDGVDGCMTPEDACLFEGVECGSVTPLDDPTSSFVCVGKPDCPASLTCVDNKCICVPDCENKDCGDDGCGDSCGTCGGGTYCNQAQKCADQVCVSGDLSCSDDGTAVEKCNVQGGAKDVFQDCAPDIGLGNENYVCFDDDAQNIHCGCVPHCEGKWCGDADGCAPTGDTSDGYSCGCTEGGESCFAQSEFPDAGDGCLTAVEACSTKGIECGDVVDASGASLSCGACGDDDTCVEGICEPIVCAASALFCQGDEVAECNETGTGSAVTATCPEEGAQLVCADADTDDDGLPDGATCVCAPDCQDKTCGDDGCGGGCGDCAANEACQNFECVCVPACDNADCGGDGCEGSCGDCADGHLCLEASCLEVTCEPFSSTCISESVSAVCNDNGTGHVSGTEAACGGNQVCDGDSCQDVICTPDQTYCENGNTVKTCNALGTGPGTGIPQFCGVGALCVEGLCLEVVCTPNEAFCEGPAVRICNDTGTGANKNIPPDECLPGTFCVAGACTDQTCSPFASYCDDNSVAVCNDTGTGPDPLIVVKDCNLHGPQHVCQEQDFQPPFGIPDAAECVCVPACDGKECGEDGCGTDCGPCQGAEFCTATNVCVECEETNQCAAGYSCVDNTCVELVCTAFESYCLSGSVLGVCNGEGTGHVTGSEQSCSAQGDNFVCQAGSCVCDSPCDPSSCGGVDPCSDYCTCGLGEFCQLDSSFPEPLVGWMSLVQGECVQCAQFDMWCSDDGLSVYLCDSLPLNGDNIGEGIVKVAAKVDECSPTGPCQEDGFGSASCGGCQPTECGPSNECGPDGCGDVCGTCSFPETCGGITPNMCGAKECQPTCGPTNQCGDDGCGGVCGECAFPDTCGAVTPNMCGCVLNTCAALGLSACGTFDDGCDGDLQCICPQGSTCTVIGLCVEDEPVENLSGCSDGSREGFLDIGTFTEIAACSGGWSVPGVHHGEGPACERLAGNDSANGEGLGCNVEDLCAAGWHVCYGDDDATTHSPSGCEGIMDGAESPAFFVSRATADGWTCAADTEGSNSPNSTNDLFGCGDMGCITDSFDCKSLQTGSHDGCIGLNHMGCECGSDPAPTTCGGGFGCTYCYGLDHWEWQEGLIEGGLDEIWECSAGSAEASTVIKSKSSQGGVLCCKDGPGSFDGGGGCVPNCGGKQCGDNGCGGTCGSCNPTLEKCVNGICHCLHPPFCL